MKKLYDEALNRMEGALESLACLVSPPERISYQSGFQFRYVEKTLHQAIVQKLARELSTLNAARLLMEHGFVQEQAALQRILDEIQEDITFLSFAAIRDDLTPLHKAYLDAFYEEEFDVASALESSQKRPMPPRAKIQAYISRIEGAALNPSRGVEVARTVSKTYSGYVHAASPHTMELYGGRPPRFHVRGIIGTGLHHAHRADLWNCFYRGILAFSFAAKAFSDDVMFENIHGFAIYFNRVSGGDYSSREWG